MANPLYLGGGSGVTQKKKKPHPRVVHEHKQLVAKAQEAIRRHADGLARPGQQPAQRPLSPLDPRSQRHPIVPVPHIGAYPGQRQALEARRGAQSNAQAIARRNRPGDPAGQKQVVRELRSSANEVLKPRLARERVAMAAESFGWKPGLDANGVPTYVGTDKQKLFGVDALRPDIKNQFHQYTGEGDPYDRKNWTTGEAYTGPNTGGGGVAGPGLRLAQESTRPLHASAGTAKALVEGKRIDQALSAGGSAFLHNTPVTYSDVLKAAGVKNRTVAGVVGFGLDLALNPGVGGRLARLSPQQATLRKAAEQEVRAAKATGRGNTVRAATKTAKAQQLRNRAQGLSDTRGIQVGYEAKVPFGPRITLMTKGKATSAIGKKLKPATEKAHASRPIQTVEAIFNPTARHAGETIAERDARVYAERKRRGGMAAAERTGTRRGTAYARNVKGHDETRIIAAVEGAAKKPLLDTKWVRRKTLEHKEVPKATRALEAAKRKAAIQRGLAADLRTQARRNGVAFEPPPRLVAAEKAVKTAKARLDGAVEAAKAVPKREAVLTDAKTGQPYHEWKAGQDTHKISDLPPKAQQVAAATRAELDALKVRQQEAGTLGQARPDYFTHRVIPQEGAARGSGGRPANNPYSKYRKDPRPIAEIEAERAAKGKPPLFSTDTGTVMGDYIRKAGQAVTDAQYLKDLKAVGKPLTQSNWDKRRPTDDLYEITSTGFKALRHPDGRAFDATQVRGLIAKGADVTILPKATGDAEIFGRAGGGRSKQLAKATAPFNRAMQAFKTSATVLNIPYYHERNFMDDSWRSWSSGATVSSFKDATKVVKEQALFERSQQKSLTPKQINGTIEVAGKKMPASEFLQWAAEDGALRTGFNAAGDLSQGSLAPAVGLRRVRPVQKVREWGQNLEDVPKVASYKAALDRGLTRAEAANHMRVHMFDYDELTDVERAVRATLIPFYTYARKNTALQARLMFTRPGKPSVIQTLREEFDKWGADGGQYKKAVAKVMPFLQDARKQGLVTQKEIDNLKSGRFDSLLTEVDQRGFPFMGPDGKLKYMPLGITDINRIPFATSWEQLKKLPAQEFDLAMQMVGPQKLPLELFQNYSFFFRDAIYRSAKEPNAERWVPAPAWGAKAGLPTIKRKINGKVVDAWPAWVDYSIRSLGPQAGILANIGNPTANARGQSLKDTLLKQASGVRSASLDNRLMAGIIDRTYKRIAAITVEMRDLGDVPKGKSSDGYFFSKKYQSLLDEQKTLGSLLDKLNQGRTGVSPEVTARLQRRPLPPVEAARKKIAEKTGGDAVDKIREKIKRDQAKAKLLASP